MLQVGMHQVLKHGAVRMGMRQIRMSNGPEKERPDKHRDQHDEQVPVHGAILPQRKAGRLKEHMWADGRYHDELIMQTLPELFAPIWARFEKGRFDRTKPRT
jgi:hypothetical protein